jgi:uncharacterized iron-regulated membrane protein
MEGGAMGNRHGLTLVEVVITMGLVFLALLALSGLATVSLMGAAIGKHLTTATFLAQEKIEQLKLIGYHSTILNQIDTDEPYESLADFPLYKRVTAIRPNTPTVGLHTITVTVSWAEDLHSVSLSTIVVE